MLLLLSSSPYFSHSYCYFCASCFLHPLSQLLLLFLLMYQTSLHKSMLPKMLLYFPAAAATHTHTHLTYTQHTHSVAASIEHFVSHFLMRLISFFSCFFFSAPCNFFPSSSSCLALFHFCANSMKNFSIMYTNTNTNTNTCAQSTHSPHI